MKKKEAKKMTDEEVNKVISHSVLRNLVEEARMDQDIINAKAIYEAGWKGYKKAIERAIELVNEEVFNTTLFGNKIPTSKGTPVIMLDLQKELKEANLMLEGDRSPEVLPADTNAKVI